MLEIGGKLESAVFLAL